MSASIAEEMIEGFRDRGGGAPRAAGCGRSSARRRDGAWLIGQRGRAELVVEVFGQPTHSCPTRAGRLRGEAMADVLRAAREIPLPRIRSSAARSSSRPTSRRRPVSRAAMEGTVRRDAHRRLANAVTDPEQGARHLALAAEVPTPASPPRSTAPPRTRRDAGLRAPPRRCPACRGGSRRRTRRTPRRSPHRRRGISPAGRRAHGHTRAARAAHGRTPRRSSARAALFCLGWTEAIGTRPRGSARKRWRRRMGSPDSLQRSVTCSGMSSSSPADSTSPASRRRRLLATLSWQATS